MSPPPDCTMGVWPRVGLVSRITLSARQCSTLARVSAIATPLRLSEIYLQRYNLYMKGFSRGFLRSSRSLCWWRLVGNHLCLVDQVMRMRSRLANLSVLWWYSSFMSSVT